MDNWEKLFVTLDNARPEAKNLSLDKVNSSSLNEQARHKDRVCCRLKGLSHIRGDESGKGMIEKSAKQGPVQTEVKVIGKTHLLLL